jgi:hypothetical protein
MKGCAFSKELLNVEESVLTVETESEFGEPSVSVTRDAELVWVSTTDF